MSEEFDDDIHEQLVKAFIEYSRWNDRFERFGYKGSSIRARDYLRQIRKLSAKRFEQILQQREAIHGIPKYKKGYQDQGTTETDDDN